MRKFVPWQNPKTEPKPPPREVAAALRGVQELEKHKGRVSVWLRAWWPAALCAGFIFFMSTETFSSEHTKWFFEPVIRWFAPWLAARQVDLVHDFIRKCAHFIEYFVFCVLLYRAVRGARTGWRWTWALLALVIAAAYSASDEVHQAFVPGRTATPYDSLLDTVGAGFAVLALYFWFRYRRPGTQTPATRKVADPAASPD